VTLCQTCPEKVQTRASQNDAPKSTLLSKTLGWKFPKIRLGRFSSKLKVGGFANEAWKFLFKTQGCKYPYMRLASFQKLRDGSFQTWDLEVSLQHSGWEICCMTPDCQFERQAKQVGTNVQSEHKTSFLELLDLFKQNVFQTLLQPKRP
jgi:hypothetical protein